MSASDERRRAQTRERLRRQREGQRQQAELPQDDVLLPDTELARGMRTGWQPSADRSAIPP
jgi:hypothetical protein